MAMVKLAVSSSRSIFSSMVAKSSLPLTSISAAGTSIVACGVMHVNYLCVMQSNLFQMLLCILDYEIQFHTPSPLSAAHKLLILCTKGYFGTLTKCLDYVGVLKCPHYYTHIYLF